MSDGRLLLVSTPWRLSGWPSLAVGVLKAHVRRHGLAVDGLHLHLDVAVRLGLARYGALADGWELGEALYFALHAPAEADAILDRVVAVLRRQGQDELARWALGEARAEVEAATLASLDALELSRYTTVGLSVGALQLGGSIYVAAELARRAPHLRIVLGGPSVLGVVGANLLARLPFVDAIVDGEGEHALAALAAAPRWTEDVCARIPNLFYRRAGGEVVRSASHTQRDLDGAPVPDLDEFYAAARAAGYPRSMLVLPVEASRGCAWEHRGGDGQLRGCTFCGLYRTSPDYREKGLDAVMADVRAGVARSGVLDVSFIDAYLPASYAKDLLRTVADSELDLTLFCEMRCDLDEEMVRLMSAAGVRRLQLGVESFHTRMLSRMAKGTRMIDNVSSIKLCEEYGIPFQYNLIVRYPGMPAAHVRELAALLPALRGFRPPSVADFYLDRGSRMYAEPARHGIDPASLDRTRLAFLPDALADAPVTQLVPFAQVDDPALRAAWDDLTVAVAAWQARHEELRALGVTQPLAYRRAGAVLVIEDWRDDDATTYQLEGVLRDALLACERVVHIDAVAAALATPALPDALAELEAHRLLVREGGWLLALPVRARLPAGLHRDHRTTHAD